MNTSIQHSMSMTPQDLADLRRAGQQLEGKSFAMTVAQKVGMPVEALLRFLPAAAQGTVSKAVNVALERCLKVALTVRPAGWEAFPAGVRTLRRLL